MAGFMTEPIIVPKERAGEFLNSLINPDREYIQRRNAIFDDMDRTINIRRNGMDMEVELQDLDLSFLDEMEERRDDGSWSVSVRLEKTDWYSFASEEMGDVHLSRYMNRKEGYEMHEIRDDSQMQIAS